MDANAAPPVLAGWNVGLLNKRLYLKYLVEDEDGELKKRSRPFDIVYVVLERGDTQIPFCLSYPKGRLVFSDTRECLTGSAGSTGRWNTRPPTKAGKRRTLTPTAWIAEVSRFIGTEQATKIARYLQQGKPVVD